MLSWKKTVLEKAHYLKAITGLIKKDSGNIDFKINKSDVAYLAQNNMTDENFPATAKRNNFMTGNQKASHKTILYKKQMKKHLKKHS